MSNIQTEICISMDWLNKCFRMAPKQKKKKIKHGWLPLCDFLLSFSYFEYKC